MDAAENYEFVRDLAAGNGGVARLMRYKPTGDLVAVKFIPRGGDRINENVAREIINHRALSHPNIILFRRVFLTPTHLAIAMEYAAGGDLLDHLSLNGPSSEDEARSFFQQVIAGVGYLHSMYVCHRDLKLDNILLSNKGPNPRLKICDFGYSKSVILHSKPNSTVGTPAYIAPEVLTGKEYDGKAADVWSCGVVLYVMVVGEYPFADPEDRSNIKKTVERIMAVRYKIPDDCPVSLHCRQLISRMLMKDPRRRIGIAEIRKHPWFARELRQEVVVGGDELMDCSRRGLQSVAEIKRIVEEARRVVPPPKAIEVLEQEAEKLEGDEMVKEVMEPPRTRLGMCRSTG